MLSKLGHLIPGIDNTILKQILTRGRGDLPSLFNNTSPALIRKLVPSKIRLLIDHVNENLVLKFLIFCGCFSMRMNQIWRNIGNY
jgi:hypothetical protein